VKSVSISVLAATGVGAEYKEFNISSPHGSVIKLNGHSVGRVDCAFVIILSPDVAWAVYPGPAGLAHFIDEVEVPSILRNERCTRQPSCASFYTLKLTRKIERLP
jgi:hypothetical protein